MDYIKGQKKSIFKVIYIAKCISMVGTTPSVDTYRDIAVTLVLVKVYNRVQKMRAHVIILYFHLVNNISMQLLTLK